MLHASDAFPSHWVLILEAALVIAGLALAANGSTALTGAGRAIHRGLRAMARRPALAIGGLALGSALYLALHTAIAGAPLPRVVDEWSYLLAADTFAHNRLANPPHPMGHHFEAPHVLQEPTYASKYPPAQGFVLAIGQVAFGHPVVGLWLSAALLVAATGWMLRAWVPPPWAIFGTILVALRLGAGSYWNQSYWGGSVAAIGGALLFGAVRRIWRRARLGDAVVLCCALAVLANSRPFEGLLVTVAAALTLLVGLVRRRHPRQWTRLLAPVALGIPLLALGLGAYNRAVTGNPLEIPHELHRRNHGIQHFLWQGSGASAVPGAAPERSLAAGAALSAPAAESGWAAPESSGWHRLAVILYFFLGLPVALALCATPTIWRDPWTRVAAASFLLLAAGHFLIVPWFSHYSAPGLALCLVPAIEAQRRVYAVRRDRRGSPARRVGPALFGAACLIQIVTFSLQIPAHRADPSDPSRQRARLAWDFEQRSGRHLLLVRYPPGWGGDWTYNPADVDAAKVVWANDLGDEANAELLRYYPDRTVWTIDAAFTSSDPVPRLVRPALSPPPP